jgi:hypothetical protein
MHALSTANGEAVWIVCMSYARCAVFSGVKRFSVSRFEKAPSFVGKVRHALEIQKPLFLFRNRNKPQTSERTHGDIDEAVQNHRVTSRIALQYLGVSQTSVLLQWHAE